MSKIFEALLRLERETGKLPPGVLAEAQEIFQNGSVRPESTVALQDAPSFLAAASETEIAAPSAFIPAEPAFDLSQVQGELVSMTPETRIVYHSQPDSAGADRFRLLRMRLWPLWEAGKLRTILVTSAHAQDGKSTIVMNLATALAEQGKRSVLVVEGDLCHPSLSPRLGIPQRAGLAECLEGAQNPLSLLRRLEPLGWYLLPAGRAQGNSTELLQIPLLANIFGTLKPYFDWIIIDTPPVVPLTDTLSLRQYADAGLLVVRAGRTPNEAVEAAIERVGSKNLLGVLLNGSDELDRVYSDYRKSYGVENGQISKGQ